MKKMKGFFVMAALFAAGSLVIGCYTMASLYGPMDTSRLDDPALRGAVGKLTLVPMMDLYGIRLDLWRFIDAHQHSSGKGSSNSPAEYAPIGVGFGNGILVDANLNVCVDLLAYFGMNEDRFGYDLYVSFGKIGKLKQFLREERNGKTAKRTQKAGIITLKLNTEIESDSAVTTGPMFHQTIKRADGGKRLLLDQKIQVFTTKSSVTQLAPDRVEFDPLAFNYTGTYVQETPTRIVFEDKLTVERLSDRIRLTSNKFAQANGTLELVPSKNGFFLIDEKNGLVTEVRKEGADFRIYMNGKLASEYRRLPAP